jgi:hypothetical protein
VLLIVGIIVVVIAIGLIVAGGGVLWANGAVTDDEGYLTTKTIRIDKNSHAVVSEPTDIEVGSWWVWDWGDLATFKIEGSNDDSSKNIFMGVADESDLNSYLRDVNYDEVIDFDINPDRLDYRNRPGSAQPAAPTTQDFWLESVNGPGTQTLEWEFQAGTWSLVLMNEDGSAGVDLSVVLGVKIPWLFGTGVGLLIGGIVALLLGTFMIFLAARRSQRPQLS